MTTTTTPTLTCAVSASSAELMATDSSNWLERLAPRMAQLFLAAWLLSSLVSALQSALWFNGYPVNGPFQLYDPLRRIAAGQRAGESFQFFHGIGIPFLHYPLFRLFGGHSLVASELSRQFTSLLLFVGSLTAFLWAAGKATSEGIGKLRWVLAAAAIILLEVLFPHSAEPGHSLISGRSAMPIFGFAVLLMPWKNWKKAIAFGACIGGAFAFGTEHGISLTLSLFAVAAVAVVQATVRKEFSAIRENAVFVVLAMATAALTGSALFLLFCGWTGAGKALHFNLGELPMDQFWFFGSPPMPYLTSLKQLVTDRHVMLCFLPSAILLCVVLLLILRGRKKTMYVGQGLQTVCVQMLTYGVLTAIPLIGILSRHYVYPQTRVLILAVAAAIAAFCGSAGHRLWRTKHASWIKTTVIVFGSVCALMSISLLSHAAVSANSLWRHSHEQVRFDHSLDQHWDNFMADATSVIRKRQTRPQVALWSEYTALLDAHYGTFQPAEDYIIHAVGPERWMHYLGAFREANPEFVTTMTSQFSFAEWLQDERWDFYEALIDNYEPVQDVAHDTIWQRRVGDWKAAPDNWQAVKLEAESVTLPAASAASDLTVLEVRYTVSNPWRKLPLIGATPRYLARVSGTDRNMAISFAPYASSFRFPVKRSPSGPVTVRFMTESFLPGAHFEVTSVRARELAPSRGTEALFTPRRIPSPY